MPDGEAIGLVLTLVAVAGLALLSTLVYVLTLSSKFKDWWKHGIELSPTDPQKKS
ncbi:hypothetical protein [Limnoglobus roseus]|uniref:Uncharacterized protein n=1 Tax=Limnoglobus roseus TaxID=2598579 RepID=A0A5C1AJM9_9BACT|nr:hypothetical protein [Limnoglobus roseus]QEL17354.1 hypothetical protein PX52LOC_04337 [Limnoglobus roseus]